MKERHNQVMTAVVKAYIESGQAVASRAISESSEVGLSSASIRNAMCDLERMGMLDSAHTSAGRIPTDHGLRYFVDSLMSVSDALQEEIRCQMDRKNQPVTEVDQVLRQANDELVRISHFAGLVSIHEPGFSHFRRLELVPVSSEQLLAVMVSDDGDVQNRLLPRPADLSDKRMHALSEQLSEMLCDCDLQTVCLRLHHEISQDRLRVRDLLQSLLQWAEKPTRKTDLLVSGQRQLLDVPELSVIDTVRSLLQTIDEKDALLNLAEQVETSNGVKIFIGHEHALVNMDQISVVLASYSSADQIIGTVGVIGPKRMQYEQVVPLVDCTAKWVSKMLGGK